MGRYYTASRGCTLQKSPETGELFRQALGLVLPRAPLREPSPSSEHSPAQVIPNLVKTTVAGSSLMVAATLHPSQATGTRPPMPQFRPARVEARATCCLTLQGQMT
ncbi:Hypothetical predicted protein [Pelobates cultripes]|uniref:Uncharacterized protein n=1 Tax=Pelobates cultripes TaxID=61616 RepID=A0AAD1T3X7_PELCU|nr:Hypothetical predicted protein [Pelobates cultripes]